MTKDIMSVDNYIIIQGRLHDILNILDAMNEPLAAVHVNQAIEIIRRHARDVKFLLNEATDTTGHS